MQMHIQLIIRNLNSIIIKIFLDPLIQSPSGFPVTVRVYPHTEAHDHGTFCQFVYKYHHLFVFSGIRIFGENIFQDIIGFLDICIVGDSYLDLQSSLISGCYIGDGRIGKSTVGDHDVLVINR